MSTGGSGQVEFAYAGNHFALGTDQIQATAVINGAAVYSNIVTQTWNAGVNQAPVVGAGFPADHHAARASHSRRSGQR